MWDLHSVYGLASTLLYNKFEFLDYGRHGDAVSNTLSTIIWVMFGRLVLR